MPSSISLLIAYPKELIRAGQNLLRKLAVNDRTQAALWALKAGVV
jgi:hypothetical protein